MKLSVVIPTLNRDPILLETLKSLEDQSFVDYEIVITSQSKVKNSQLLEYVKSHKNISMFEQLDKKGAAANRNLGIKKSEGDIVLFLDDDILPLSKHLFKKHVKAYSEEGIQGTVGKVIVDDGTLPPDPRGVGKVTSTGDFIDNWSSDKKAYITSAISCNMSISRIALDRVSGFDENYLAGMREDSDISMRITRKGKMVYLPEAGVHHLKATVGGGENRGEMEDKIDQKEKYDSRIEWYRRFFHNEILFFMKNMNGWLLPVFIVLHKLRPILACMFYFGKAKPVAFITPFKGMVQGYSTYLREKKENNKWL